jgi:hypothetical protein
MPETQHESWIDWLKNIQLFGIALLIPLWRAIDKYFEYQSKKDREFIKQVVDESMYVNMKSIKEDLKELKGMIDQDRKDNRKEILDLTREISKSNRP